MENELFPVVSGLLIGLLVAVLRPKLRARVGVVLAAVFGVLATIVSGEFRIGWEYLLIDIPLVSVSAAAAVIAVRAFQRRRRNWSA
jgi:hypothetical protein